jgi:uncharacterized protein (TIGR02145 family)
MKIKGLDPFIKPKITTVMEKMRIMVNQPMVSILAFLLLFTCSCKETDPVPSIVFNPTVTYGSMKDQDGNTYKTVTIGTQTWMAENLRTTKYRNGDLIPTVTDDKWKDLTTGASCIYDNDKNNAGIYGRLYNYYAVNDSRNIAPAGWHVPTDAEWSALTAFTGGDSVAAYKLIETGTGHWTHNVSATNETGFTALPGGYRGKLVFAGADLGYNYIYKGSWGFWWSSSDSLPSIAWERHLVDYSGKVMRGCKFKDYGFSVRCVKD